MLKSYNNEEEEDQHAGPETKIDTNPELGPPPPPDADDGAAPPIHNADKPPPNQDNTELPGGNDAGKTMGAQEKEGAGVPTEPEGYTIGANMQDKESAGVPTGDEDSTGVPNAEIESAGVPSKRTEEEEASTDETAEVEQIQDVEDTSPMTEEANNTIAEEANDIN
eukprot:2087131-Ditylum_brightwellii.AAC.2